MEEAQTFWSPRVDVTLSAVAAVMRPRWSFALVKGKREDAVFAEIESNQFLIPPGVSGVTLLDS
ncbi:MAG: hypothetical protein R3E12_10580 [Candidatus Eisenbacteria bacterium]